MREPTRSERELPSFWVRELNACIKRNQPQIDRYIRFCRWYRGNLEDLIDPDATPNLDRPWQSSLDNMHTFVTDAAIAQMFFRNPRGAIRTPGKGWGVWTAGLARVEAAALNDTIEQIGYFRRARRRLLDARNGPFGILKITYDCDMVVDMEAIEAAREEAALENQQFMLGRPKAMEAREDQIHSAHIDKHRELLAMAERGEIMLPKSAIKYLRKHIAIHEAMRTTERPTETVRDSEIVVRRVSPLDWFYDVTVDDIADSRWFTHTYLMRKVDALANDRFSKKSRDVVSDSPDRWVRSGVNGPSGVPSTGTFDNSDVMVRVYEVFDRVEGVIREFFEGGEEMADQRDFTMRSVQPSGPYSILMFKPDPMEAGGIPPPIGWEAEQHADTTLQSAMVSAAIAGSKSRGVFDSNVISPEKVEEIANSPNGTWYPINLPPNKDDIRKVMTDAPTLEIKEQTLAIRADVRGRISQSSGLGQQRTLSGDKAGSATEAAITSGAADAISEDQAAILDDASAYDFKMIVRLTRKCKTKAQIVEIVGPDAQEWYPETWADRDIVNDRNVYVVPGSSRRRSTDVQSKLTTDFIIGMAALPAMQLPEGQSLILEAARRVADDMGLAGLDWDAVDNAQKAMAMIQQQMAMAGAGQEPGAEEGGKPSSNGKAKPPKNRQRSSEMTEPSMAGQAQGAANVGGGRVATGASAGDQMDLMRARSGGA